MRVSSCIMHEIMHEIIPQKLKIEISINSSRVFIFQYIYRFPTDIS